MTTTPWNFLSAAETRDLAERFGTPLYIYDEATLVAAAGQLKQIPAPFGFTPRFAMKALPTRAILEIFAAEGLGIDASSSYEARRALLAGVEGRKILLTSQELGDDFPELVERGVAINACSLSQLARYGERFPGTEISMRVNPGLGSGHCNRTNVGGPSSSFGIWHEQLGELAELLRRFSLTVTRLHSHVGSGTDPETWERCCELTLNFARHLPSVTTVNLGGGFKVARMPDENSADLPATGRRIADRLTHFAASTGRELHLELEPGTFLVAPAGVILARVIDVVHTGAEGYSFAKIDSGMTEIVRPALYGAQHPIVVVPREERGHQRRGDFLVVGHCCESGDILTPDKGDPEGLRVRDLVTPQLGDLCLIGYTGAYCSGFAMKNFNSFPEAAEVLRRGPGEFDVIKERQPFEEMLTRERAWSGRKS